MSIEAKQATPHWKLISELMDSCVPKTEREHAAVREIERLRVAIAEASMQRLTDVQQEMEQEPVAWRHTTAMGHHYFRLKPQDPMFKPVPLYMHPPRREWVGLTNDEIWEISQHNADDCEYVLAIEAKLKEKNS